MKKIILCIITILLLTGLFAQTSNRSIINAAKFYEIGNYNQALLSMDRVEPADRDNADYALMMGKIYLAQHEYKNAHQWLAKYVNVYGGTDVLGSEVLLKKTEQAAVLQENSAVKIAVRRVIGEINSNDSDYAPILVNKGQSMILASNKRSVYGKENIFICHLIKDRWTEPVEISALCTDGNECIGSASKDESLFYISGQYQQKEKANNIYTSKYENDRFSKPAIINELKSEFNDVHPFVFDDKVMFFASNREGDRKHYDIYVSEYKNGAWSNPVNLGKNINSDLDEQTPALSPDGTTLYFSSNGLPGYGKFDVFFAKRVGDSWTEWTPAENFGPIINSNMDDRFFRMNPESKLALMSSNRFNGQNLEDIYHADMSVFDAKPVVKPKDLIIAGTVVDENNQPVSTSIRWSFLQDGQQNEMINQSDKNGKFNFKLPKGNEINYNVENSNYKPYSDKLNAGDKDSVFVLIQLQSIPKNIELYGQVSDNQNNLLEADIVWSYTQNDTKNEKTASSNQSGLYSTMIPVLSQVNYKVEKKGYLATTGSISIAPEQKRVKTDFILTKIEMNKDIKIENVQFDFGKATLTQGSLPILDNLVKTLNDNPNIQIEISGHTDNIGSKAINDKLSKQRAQAVVDYLVSKGISSDRLTAEGYGFSKPIASNATKEGRDLNRRVAMSVKKAE